MSTRAVRPYADATYTGIILGLILLASFVLAGRGLGASGAFAVVVGDAIGTLAPEAIASPALSERLPSDESPFDSWIVLEIVGVIIGAAISARLAGRMTRGDSSRPRLMRAVMGGLLMGIGARLAYGCTSGLGLTGGATLATGAWVFIPVAFATAALVTFAARGEGAPHAILASNVGGSDRTNSGAMNAGVDSEGSRSSERRIESQDAGRD